MKAKRSGKPRKEAALLLGVGFDAEPGEKRVTKGRDFLMVGGSEETHDRLTEHAIKLNEELDRRGIRLAEVRGKDEMIEIVHRAWR
jgi:hypothetical protein